MTLKTEESPEDAHKVLRSQSVFLTSLKRYFLFNLTDRYLAGERGWQVTLQAPECNLA